MEIPGIGTITDDCHGVYYSDPVRFPVLGGAACEVAVPGYGDGVPTEDVHAAVSAFLALDESVLKASAPAIFDYYLDIRSEVGDEPGFPVIAAADDVWQHIR